MFEHLGFFKEYYIGSKLIGTLPCDEDRPIGYAGRKNETFSEAIIFNNGKKIKPGTEVTTMIYPLNGKIIK